MNKGILRKILFAAMLTILLPETGHAFQQNKYYASLTATVAPSGAGTVYVDGEDNNATYGESCINYKNSNTRGSWGGTVNITATARANNGYSFNGWKNEGGEFVSSDLSFSNDYAVSNTPSTRDDAHAQPHTIVADFSPIVYTVTYLPGDQGSGSMSTSNYDIVGNHTINNCSFSHASGYKFKEWKVTSYLSGSGWTAGEIVHPGDDGSGKWGDITLTAQWEALPCHIVIELSGMDSGESGIFTVTRTGMTPYTVMVPSGSSITLTNLIPGQYTVTPTTWSWVYSGLETPQTKDVDDSGQTFTFVATKKPNVKKHDEKAAINLWQLPAQ